MEFTRILEGTGEQRNTTEKKTQKVNLPPLKAPLDMNMHRLTAPKIISNIVKPNKLLILFNTFMFQVLI